MSTETVTYKVELEVYNGPFDLLIKAIDEGQIDIYNVSIGQITASYFAYWRQVMPNLIAASEFLVMAAYLLELKAKALLPAKDEIIQEELMADIEGSLLSHIEEYQIFKNLAMTLKQRKEKFERIYGRHEGEKQEKEIELVDVSLKDLVLAFQKVYQEAAKRESVVEIPVEEVTLEERLIEIKRLLAGRKDGVPLEDLFTRRTTLEVVVTFLAILELAKQRYIKITQGRRFGSILIFALEIWEAQNGIPAAV